MEGLEGATYGSGEAPMKSSGPGMLALSFLGLVIGVLVAAGLAGLVFASR